MKLVPLDNIFDIQYGNQLDLYKLNASEENGINFVSRTRENLGIVSKVGKIATIEPFDSGLITVSLGGSYLLSSFVQPEPFYTAQNIKVLRPKRQMSFTEKIFYCKAIEKNRFRYSSHGREANKSLEEIEVPDQVPSNVLSLELDKKLNTKIVNDDSIKESDVDLNSVEWKFFNIGGKNGIFKLEKGYYNKKPPSRMDGEIPFFGASKKNYGITSWHYESELEKIYGPNKLLVTNNGSTCQAYYADQRFTCSHDVNILQPKQIELNKFIAIFLISIIKLDAFRWSYGRKWRIMRMKDSEIKLPVDNSGKVNWEFMESYIKFLPFSKTLALN